MTKEKPKHTDWFVHTDSALFTSDGKEVLVLEFQYHEDDQEVMSEWAKYFRDHYCSAETLQILCRPLNKTSEEYFNDHVAPDRKSVSGPRTMSGTFGEILVADYFEWIEEYYVPRVRWQFNGYRNRSPFGCDVIGFRFHDADRVDSPDDELLVIECKARLSASESTPFRSALKDSPKDLVRIAESLTFLQQTFYNMKCDEDREMVERFQNSADRPHRRTFGAAAVISSEYFDSDEITSVRSDGKPASTPAPQEDTQTAHQISYMLVITGSDLLELMYKLYREASRAT